MVPALIRVLFLVSGFTGLLYEIGWVRRASLVFGSTIFALSTILSVFFLGLAIGGLWFGRLSVRVSTPLKSYGYLEIGIAVFALLTIPGFDMADWAFGSLHRMASGQPAPLATGRVLLVALVVLPASILLGGTLPLFVRHALVTSKKIAGSVGYLYAINTLGAAAGCVATGFFLLPTLGFRATVLLGAGLNLLVGIIALALARRAPAVIPGPPEARVDAGRRPSARIVPAIFFITGFAVLALEVLWTCYLALLIPNTIHTVTITLAAVLLGVVIGSSLAAPFYDGRAPRARLFGALQVTLGLVALLLFMIPVDFWRGFGERYVIAFLIILPPAILSGASFPLAVRLVTDDPALGGAAAGRMAAINTLGGIAGSLFAGFVSLPWLGLQVSVLLVTGLCLLSGALAWIQLEGAPGRPARIAAAFVAVAAWVLIPVVTGTSIPRDALARRADLVAWKEGLESNLAVVRTEDVLKLEINRLWQGQDGRTHQVMAAHVPMMLHRGPRRVLVVGAGAGQTPRRVLLYDIDRLDVVDIEPAVFDLIREHFDGAGWMADPRVTLIKDDGRNHIAHTTNRYDVISLEVGQVYRPGAAAFYTADFYRDLRDRLAPNGLVSQFVPLPFFEPDAFAAVIATFRHVFPQSVLWYNTSELLLVGTNGDRIALDRDRLDLPSANAALKSDLDYSHWGGTRFRLSSPAVFLGGFLAGPAGLDQLAAGGALLHDDRPMLEYATSRIPEGAMLEIPLAAEISRHLDSPATITAFRPDSATIREAGLVRARNLGDIAAAAHLRDLERIRNAAPPESLWGPLRRALAANPDNLTAARLAADLLVIEGQIEPARDIYEKVVRENPDDGRAHRGLGYALHRAGRLEEAVEHYRQALAILPNDAEAHNNYGVALAARGDAAGALRHFETALRLRPDYPDAARNLARAAGSGEALTQAGASLPAEAAGAAPVSAAPIPVEPDSTAWLGALCASCRMYIEHTNFVSRLDTADGRRLYFDDPGCLIIYLHTDRPPNPVISFRHFGEPRWIPLAEAAFVRHESTPMAFGYAAVAAGTPGSLTFRTITDEMVERFSLR